MNKTAFFILIGLFIFQSGYTQSFKKRKALSKTFLKKVRVREVLDTMLWDKESAIFNQTGKWFKEKKIDINNRKDYEFFHSRLMKQFTFSKKYILNRVKYHYLHVNHKLLQKYINEINKGKLQNVIYNSGLFDLLNQFIKEELNQIKRVTIPKLLNYLVLIHKPVYLEIKFNNKLVDAKKIDLDIVVETNNADYRRVSILDKEDNRLFKPKGYKYEQIQKIIIIYKGQEFSFGRDIQKDYYPSKFKELNTLISEYSYTKIPIWKLNIMETNEHISVQLINAVKSKIIKEKERSNKKEPDSLDRN